MQGLVQQLAGEQQDDGHWGARGQFPTQRRPMEESDDVASMWTMLAFESIRGADGRTDDAALTRRRSASRWLDASDDGKTTEWRSKVLPVYRRRTKAADALIASAYLSGTNTRRVRRALATSLLAAIRQASRQGSAARRARIR